MPTSIWKAVVIWPHGSTHLVSTDRIEQTVQDLVDRGVPAEAVEVLEVDAPWTFDMPGMIWNGRTMLDFKVDTLELKIPAHDLGRFITNIRKLPLRTFADGTDYYKLHAFSRCLVLSPDQRAGLQRLMEEAYPDAEAAADEDIRKMAKIRQQLAEESPHFPKVRLMSRDTSKN
jgi:hypothetical protein